MGNSDHDGECCNAARLACRLLRTHGLTWEQALQASDRNDERGSLWDQAFARLFIRAKKLLVGATHQPP
jgi:hypothetical protein